jgi:hypothetical protein
MLRILQLLLLLAVIAAPPVRAADADATGAADAQNVTDDAEDATSADSADAPSEAEILAHLEKHRPMAHRRLQRLKKENPERFRRAIEAMRNLHRMRRERDGDGDGGRSGAPDAAVSAWRGGRMGGGPGAAMGGGMGRILDDDAHEALRENRDATQALRNEIRTLLHDLRHVEDEADRKRIMEIIRSKVEEAFDLTTERRRIAIEAGKARLEEARRRLEDADEMLKSRIEHRKEHIDSFLDEIVETGRLPKPARGPGRDDTDAGE